MTNQDNHQNNVVQDIQRVASQISEVLLDLAIEASETGHRDHRTEHKCRKTLRNIAYREFRNEWEQFYSIYSINNGVK